MRDPQEASKRAAGEQAATLVSDGMRIGLGTGSTARWFIEAVGARVANGLRVEGVATSARSESHARLLGIPIVELDEHGLDLAVDGADAVDPELRLIKGAGAALLREKIVAAAARRFVVVVDETKIMPALHGRLPAEVIPFGWRATRRRVAEVCGTDAVLRTEADGAATRTDNGNLILDAWLDEPEDPEALSAELAGVPGVAGHGLFLNLATLVIVAGASGELRELRA